MNITKIIQLLSDTGILGIVIFLFVAWFNRINPAVKTKIASNKSANQREALGLLDNLASNAVHLLSASYEMPGDEKREKAVADVTSQLNGLGHNVDPAIISAAIEKAYQSMTTTETKAQAKQVEYNAALADTEQAFADKQAQLDKQAATVPADPAPLNVPEGTATTEGDAK
ncbi:phage holin, LLH family [Levilactobacillus brevis]|uniref:Phage holin, LLH family n=1 Tax=Levilactobacillus brevis TaxID=1580 RepID=A0AB38X817_LEVBR|nr:phage holin, LLH family [Levilactobacillus brevis]WAD02111.1 phage holin, LLH family [Levilactobacillus brevis]